jgi:hypothetical protein
MDSGGVTVVADKFDYSRKIQSGKSKAAVYKCRIGRVDQGQMHVEASRIKIKWVNKIRYSGDVDLTYLLSVQRRL